MGHLWLRTEYKSAELRTPLIPAHAKQLVEEGHRVTVEDTIHRAFPVEAYRQAGCHIVAPGSWEQAPLDAYILGLKNLPDSNAPLLHRHIYFAHAYKGQHHAQRLIQRFAQGSGAILDLEFLLDANGKRVAAFGYYAGIVGAALSVMLWCHKMRGDKASYRINYPCHSYDGLIDEIKLLMREIGKMPSVLVIGAKGRCGSGATHFLENIGLEPRLWGRKDTKRATMSHEMLAHDIMLNCIYVDETTSPFLTKQDFVFNRALSVIGDISCEPDHECNPLPFYTKATSFDKPALRVWEKNQTVDLISIDNLPTFLPTESSVHFSGQLIPYLSQLLANGVTNPVWRGALEKFEKVKKACLSGAMKVAV